MEYQRLCTISAEGNPINIGTWIPYGSDPFKHIPSVDHTYYLSPFIYSDKQFEEFKKNNYRVGGIEDVTTDRIYWDFDSKEDLNKAKSDTQELCQRLIKAGIKEDSILPCFSGEKGFSVDVKIDQRLTPEEVKNIASNIAEGLTTFDSTLYNPTRIFRLPATRHQRSGLYKTPIHVADLSKPIEEIKQYAAQKPKPVYITPVLTKIPESILQLKKVKERVVKPSIEEPIDLDFRHKPKGFSNCKFAIMNGFFPDGERHNSLLVLASTCRANGFPKETAYSICDAAMKQQMERFGSDEFPEKELRRTVESTYSSSWNGGQFTCKTNDQLKRICESLGVNKCKHLLDDAIEPDAVFDLFKNYAVNYDKNVLTTGIGPLDKEIKFLIGTSNGILAPPGVGKTSVSLSILNHNSKENIPSLFFSYDMYHSLLYARMVQKQYGYTQERIFDIIKNDPVKTADIKETLKKEYGNVRFCFKTGQTPQEINQTILDTEERIGNKVKLVIIDYNELVIATTSDPTQASAQVAQSLRQIANERECCIITLLQPSKLYSNPSDDITSYQGAKGSSAIAQSMTSMLALSRPGYNPRYSGNDKFLSIFALKNRNGPLFSLDLGWNGLRGNLTELSYEDEQMLQEIRAKKELEDEESRW